LRLVLLINVYILSSTKLEMRANTICLEARGWGQEGRGQGERESNDPIIICTYE
jgi:hypothetical protein